MTLKESLGYVIGGFGAIVAVLSFVFKTGSKTGSEDEKTKELERRIIELEQGHKNIIKLIEERFNTLEGLLRQWIRDSVDLWKSFKK